MDDSSGRIMRKTVLYAIRHGDTANNQEKKFRGWLNVDLALEGRQQAEEVKKQLSNVAIGKVYCSPLNRAVDTCAIVFGERPEIGVAYMDSLKPLNVGDLANEKKDIWRGFIDQAALDWSVSYPSGESINQFVARLRVPILQMLLAGVEGLPSAAVWHSSNMHTLGAIVNGDHNSALVAPGGIVEVTVEDGKFFAKPIFNAKSEAFN